MLQKPARWSGSSCIQLLMYYYLLRVLLFISSEQMKRVFLQKILMFTVAKIFCRLEILQTSCLSAGSAENLWRCCRVARYSALGYPVGETTMFLKILLNNVLLLFNFKYDQFCTNLDLNANFIIAVIIKQLQGGNICDLLWGIPYGPAWFVRLSCTFLYYYTENKNSSLT